MMVANSAVPDALINRLQATQGTPHTSHGPTTHTSVQKPQRTPNSQAMVTRPSARKHQLLSVAHPNIDLDGGSTAANSNSTRTRWQATQQQRQ